MLLVGDDAVRFNRCFAARRLDERCLRLSPLMDESMLLASGAGATAGLWTAAGYFEQLVTPESMDFGHRYASRFGPAAPRPAASANPATRASGCSRACRSGRGRSTCGP